MPDREFMHDAGGQRLPVQGQTARLPALPALQCRCGQRATGEQIGSREPDHGRFGGAVRRKRYDLLAGQRYGSTAQFDGEITPRQDGGYVVVWTDLSLTYNPQGGAIVGQRYDSAGNKIGGDPAHGGEVNLSLFPNGNQSRPAVTTLANGDIAERTPICSPATATSRCIFSIRRCILSEPT